VLRILRPLLWVCAVATAFPAVASQAVSGNELYEDLLRTTDVGSFGVGFISGVAAALNGDPQKGVTYAPFCIPDGVVGRQLRDIVFKFMRDRPEARHYPARQLIMAALAPVFPCP
jgi:hypothetical protein